MYRLSVIRQEALAVDGKGKSEMKTWEGIPLRPDNLPAEAFIPIMNDVVDFFGFNRKIKKKQHRASKGKNNGLKLPDSPLEMVRNADSDPLKQAYYMQLLGLLTPTSCGLEIQKEFFLRSLYILEQLNEPSMDKTLLRARAYLYLDQRPKALSLIGSPESPEAKAFKEFLDANLPDQEANIQQIESL